MQHQQPILPKFIKLKKYISIDVNAIISIENDLNIGQRLIFETTSHRGIIIVEYQTDPIIYTELCRYFGFNYDEIELNHEQVKPINMFSQHSKPSSPKNIPRQYTPRSLQSSPQQHFQY
jgi:hypothetical protein